MRKFGIYSPVFGANQNVPSILLDKAASPDTQNVRFYRNRIQMLPLRKEEFVNTGVKVATPDGNPPMEIANVFDVDGNEQVIVFTKNHIYLWVGGTSSYTDITPGLATQNITSVADDGGDAVFTVADHNFSNGDLVTIAGTTNYNGTGLEISEVTTNTFKAEQSYVADETGTVSRTSLVDVEYWSVTEYQGTLVFVNGNHEGIWYLSGGTPTRIDTHYVSTGTAEDNEITSAKYCWAFKNYLFLGNLIYTDSASVTINTNIIVNSNLGLGITNDGFEQDTGGDAGFYVVEGRGTVSGAGISGSMFVVFKTDSCRRYWFAGGSIPFNSESLYETLGSRAPGSIVNGRIQNSLYFYGSDNNFHEITRGNVGVPIVVTENDLNQDALINIRSKFVREYKEIYWSVPVGAEQESNNLCLVYKEDGRWSFAEMPISAFGEYSQVDNLTWDTNPYDTWDSIPSNIGWNSSAQSKNVVLDICGSPDTYVYRTNGSYTDDGDLYTSYFVLTTDLANKQGLQYKKRISQVYVYFDNIGVNGQEIVLETKRQQETNWRTIAKFELNDSGTNNDIFRSRQPIDIFGSNFMFRVSSQYNFSFIGMEFDFEVINNR